MPLKLKPPALPNQPPPDTPSSATSVKRKLTITFGGASQSTPTATEPPAPTSTPKKPKVPRKPKTDKPARTAKPTPKKREFDASALADDDEKPKESGLANVKRLKLSISGQSKPRPPSPPKDDNLKGVKYVRTKFKGKIPERPVGVGYDSCSSDVEDDPALEEEFILRMQPGEDCEYIRQAIADRRWGPTHEGGADVRMQFLQEDGRRAVVSVQKRLYAACLVDLPCVIEGMKSWDKKAWFKTADICQMLMVLGRIENMEEAMQFPLPRDVDPKTWQYAHGLTPPMRYARKRRFRKRISRTAIEAVEEEVERLLRQDEECVEGGGESKYETLDPNRLTQEQQEAEAHDDEEDAEGDEYEDAEGDEDIENAFEPIVGNAEEVDDDAAMEAALLAEMEDDDAAPEPDNTINTTTTTPQPTQTIKSDSPAAETPSQPVISDSEPPSVAATPAKATDDTGDSDDAESSDEDAQASELDDAELEQKQERERQWAEINDMKAMIKGQEEKAAAQPNAILKSKILAGVRGLKRDFGVKLAALGVEEEGDEG